MTLPRTRARIHGFKSTAGPSSHTMVMSCSMVVPAPRPLVSASSGSMSPSAIHPAMCSLSDSDIESDGRLIRATSTASQHGLRTALGQGGDGEEGVDTDRSRQDGAVED